MSQAAVVLVVIFFAGIILVMLSQMGPCEPTTLYKYLPRDLDTYLREEPPVSVTTARIFDQDDYSLVTGRVDYDTSNVQSQTLQPLGYSMTSVQDLTAPAPVTASTTALPMHRPNVGHHPRQ